MSQAQVIGPPFVERDLPLLESKLRPLLPLSGTVSRPGLINRLRATAAPIVAVVAPAGYGKTTLLSQWAERDVRPSAWISLDEQDNDPSVLLSYVGAAHDRLLGLEPSVLVQSAAAHARTWRSTLAGLAAGLAASDKPIVLVLDCADVLSNRDSLRIVSVLADHLSAGSALALACRSAPKLPIARWRAGGRLFELGPDELAMTGPEARVVVRNAGANASDEQLADLAWRTESWPAGLYLSALSLASVGLDSERNGAPGRGHDRFVMDYLRLEVLSSLSEAELSLLTRLSVLDRFCPSLCSAVLDPSDHALAIDELEAPGHFLVALDPEHEWYRFRRPFRDVLRAELDRRDPEAAPVLASCAADWYEAHGLAEQAVEYAHTAGETDRVARLVSKVWFSVLDSGRLTTLARWLDWLDEDAVLERFPRLAVAGAWVTALTGREAEALGWLETATRNADGVGHAERDSIAPLVALVRAAICRDGVAAMRADAELALCELAPRSPYRPTALALLGIAQILAGDDEEADSLLAEAAEQTLLRGGAVAGSVALAERALLAIARGDPAEGERLAQQAREVVRDAGLDEYPTSSLVHAVTAHTAVRHGDVAGVRKEVVAAARLLSGMAHALPWLSTQSRLELARVQTAIADDAGAKAALAELGSLPRCGSDLGTLGQRVRELKRQLTVQTVDDRRSSSLTSAELRLIPLLSTHLSFREIADRLFVSRNTVKTQAISVYRKLGVSSRSEAIARAAQLGLVDEPALPTTR